MGISDGMGTAAVAGPDGQQGVRVHAMARHGDLSAVREDVFGDVFKSFYKTEDIIPAATIQARHVIF